VLALAAAFLATVPALWLVVDRPERVGQSPHGAGVRPQDGAPQPVKGDLSLLANPLFLLLTLASGLAMGAGISKSVHFMPMLVERGVDVRFAALLLALSGGSGVLGALLFGYLTDRFNAALVLTGNVVVQGLIWTIPLFTINTAALLTDAVAIGICTGGFTNAQAVLSKRLFGGAYFGKVLGFTSLLTLPFYFGINPLAGLLRDWTGSYTVPILSQSAGFAVAALCLLLIAKGEAGQSPGVQEDAVASELGAPRAKPVV
jgi:predicted MFS family arabinose efflux permease